MKITKKIKSSLKKFFNVFGFDIIRLTNNPKEMLLGLKNLPIKTIIDVGANEG